MVEVWQQISLHESRDLVTGLYRTKHGSDLPPDKAREVTSCFTQGRQFFDSASGAFDLVRPLILYYGVLALSRGLTLLLVPGLRLTHLSPSHGIDAKGWGATLLAADGLNRIPELPL